ncbi:MAG: hypothetical protein DRJ47_00570 [Thermoprotei archaeon]|nr:MAG: hypothetical protein DRJ47_00570 [Thermoprotei archaeon]
MSLRDLLVRFIVIVVVLEYSVIVLRWLEGRRRNALESFTKTTLSILASLVFIQLLNPWWVSRIVGVPFISLDLEEAYRRVESISGKLAARISSAASGILASYYVETFFMVLASLQPYVTLTFTPYIKLASDTLTTILYSFTRMYSFALVILLLVKELISLSIRLSPLFLTVGALTPVFTRGRRLALTFLLWGILLGYVLPFSVNTVISGIRIPPLEFNDLGEPGVALFESNIPYMVLVLEGDAGTYIFQLNKYGKRLLVLPLGNYRLKEAVVCWVKIPLNMSIQITKPLLGNLSTVASPQNLQGSAKGVYQDGYLFYEGEADVVEINVPAAPIMVNGSLLGIVYLKNISCGIVYNNGLELSFNINAEERVEMLVVGAQPEAVESDEFKVYYNLSYMPLEDFNIKWVEPQFLINLYNSYVTWIQLQNWLNSASPTIGLLDEASAREYATYRPQSWLIRLRRVESQQHSRGIIELKFKPSGKPWALQPWLTSTPLLNSTYREALEKDFSFIAELFSTVYSLLVNFILTAFAFDILGGFLGGYSLTGTLGRRLSPKTYSFIYSTLTIVHRTVFHLGKLASNILSKRFTGGGQDSLMASRVVKLGPPGRAPTLKEKISITRLKLEKMLAWLKNPGLQQTLAKSLSMVYVGGSYAAKIFNEKGLTPLIFRLACDAVGIYNGLNAPWSTSKKMLDKMYTFVSYRPEKLSRSFIELFQRASTIMEKEKFFEDLSRLLETVYKGKYGRRILESGFEVDKVLKDPWNWFSRNFEKELKYVEEHGVKIDAGNLLNIVRVIKSAGYMEKEFYRSMLTILQGITVAKVFEKLLSLDESEKRILARIAVLVAEYGERLKGILEHKPSNGNSMVEALTLAVASLDSPLLVPSALEAKVKLEKTLGLKEALIDLTPLLALLVDSPLLSMSISHGSPSPEALRLIVFKSLKEGSLWALKDLDEKGVLADFILDEIKLSILEKLREIYPLEMLARRSYIPDELLEAVYELPLPPNLVYGLLGDINALCLLIRLLEGYEPPPLNDPNSVLRRVFGTALMLLGNREIWEEISVSLVSERRLIPLLERNSSAYTLILTMLAERLGT